MKKPNLTLAEIESAAELIRITITNGESLSLPNYIQAAKNLCFGKLGHRLNKMLIQESHLMAYFPDEVYKALTLNVPKNLRFNDLDFDFIRNNAIKGTSWLATHFYTTNEQICLITKAKGIPIVKMYHNFSEEEVKFMNQFGHRGPKWVANKMGIDENRVSCKLWKMGIRYKIPQSFRFSKDQDNFIREHKENGTTWIAEKLGVSQQSIRIRSKRLHLNIPVVRSDEKQIHSFSKFADRLIMENKNKGTKWLSENLPHHPPIKKILHRASKLGIVLADGRSRYTKEEEDFISQHADCGSRWIGEQLGRSSNQIQGKAKCMKVKLKYCRKTKS